MGREDMRKPAISAGNEAFSTGTGPRAGAQFSDNLRRGRRDDRRSFFMPWTAQEGPRTAAGPWGVCGGPGAGNPCRSSHTRQEGRSTRPGSQQQQRRKRAGFAAHGEIIADRPEAIGHFHRFRVRLSDCLIFKGFRAF